MLVYFAMKENISFKLFQAELADNARRPHQKPPDFNLAHILSKYFPYCSASSFQLYLSFFLLFLFSTCSRIIQLFLLGLIIKGRVKKTNEKSWDFSQPGEGVWLNPDFLSKFSKTIFAFELPINVMKHTLHKWGGSISSIHNVINGGFLTLNLNHPPPPPKKSP